jgi:hypothetical protein
MSLAPFPAIAQASFEQRWRGGPTFEEIWDQRMPVSGARPIPTVRIATPAERLATPSSPLPSPLKGEAKLYAEWRRWGAHAVGPKVGQVAIFADTVGWVVAVPDVAHVTIKTRSHVLTRAIRDVLEYRAAER